MSSRRPSRPGEASCRAARHCSYVAQRPTWHGCRMSVSRSSRRTLSLSRCRSSTVSFVSFPCSREAMLSGDRHCTHSKAERPAQWTFFCSPRASLSTLPSGRSRGSSAATTASSSGKAIHRDLSRHIAGFNQRYLDTSTSRISAASISGRSCVECWRFWE